eukprot:Colp12_sorted_trinity150504_noHs@6355
MPSNGSTGDQREGLTTTTKVVDRVVRGIVVADPDRHLHTTGHGIGGRLDPDVTEGEDSLGDGDVVVSHVLKTGKGETEAKGWEEPTNGSRVVNHWAKVSVREVEPPVVVGEAILPVGVGIHGEDADTVLVAIGTESLPLVGIEREPLAALSIRPVHNCEVSGPGDDATVKTSVAILKSEVNTGSHHLLDIADAPGSKETNKAGKLISRSDIAGEEKAGVGNSASHLRVRAKLGSTILGALIGGGPKLRVDLVWLPLCGNHNTEAEQPHQGKEFRHDLLFTILSFVCSNTVDRFTQISLSSGESRNTIPMYSALI